MLLLDKMPNFPQQSDPISLDPKAKTNLSPELHAPESILLMASEERFQASMSPRVMILYFMGLQLMDSSIFVWSGTSRVLTLPGPMLSDVISLGTRPIADPAMCS